MAKPTKPNPGSPEALDKGCACPVLDNARGRGIGIGGDLFWVNQDCPLHGRKQEAVTDGE